MITSLQNIKIKEIVKLKQKKNRDQYRKFIVEGEHLVEEALKSGILLEVYTSKISNYSYENMIEVSDEVIRKISSTKSPQPIIGICEMKQNNELDYTNHKFLILDGLQDPGNVGTLIRAAVAFGYNNLILSESCVDLYNDKVIRSTQGALFYINYIKCDLLKAINELKKNNVTVIGTSLHNAISINQTEKKDKIAIVLGNEGNGVSLTVLDNTDLNVYIPIESTESLNVAIAGAICMYHYQ